jgi:acyl dehydratase
MAGLKDLAGRSFGPFPVDLSRSRVGRLAAATGDDPGVWDTHVPPYAANAALFAVAPAFLEDESVSRLTRSLIHSEQAFEWGRAPVHDEAMEVMGRVDSVRARGALNLASFSFEAASPQGRWVTGSSVFLLSAQAAAASDDRMEPPPLLRPDIDPMSPSSLPPEGAATAPVRVGASREDVIRYAAASGDWNPIHWDHDSARRAGLSGTIVHGLLMTAWLTRAAMRYAASQPGVVTMKARFRSPLAPGEGAAVSGSVLAVGEDDAELDLVLASGEERMVTARFRVTR